MTTLQKINLGTAPTGQDGDTNRSANVKMNSNVDVLNAQVALTTAATITVAQALTNAHVGKRVNIALAVAGSVNLPTASTCAADNVILLRNIGTTIATLAITSGSGDTVALSKLNPGETALMDTDGVHTWAALMRGRTNSDNEVVNGNCTVGGTLSVKASTPVVVINDTSGSNDATVNLQSNGVTRWSIVKGAGNNFGVKRFDATGTLVDQPLTIAQDTGVASLLQRPTFAGKTPWDSGNLVSPWSTANLVNPWSTANLANPATTDTAQTVTGAKTFSGAANFSATSAFTGVANFFGWGGGSYTTSQVNIAGTILASIGFNSSGIGGILRLDSGAAGFQFLNFNASAYVNITCSNITQTSDRALKTGIVPLSGVLQKLRGKCAVSYSLKADPENTRHIGVIAQDWQADFPELVVDAGVDIDEDGDFIAHQYDEESNEIFGPNGKPESRKALGFNYSNAAAVAIQGVIELQAALDAALARIAALEAGG
jgi:hypothetical protein